MSLKSAIFVTSALIAAGLMASSIGAMAGGMSHIGSWGGAAGGSSVLSGPNCKQGGGHFTAVNRPTTINNNLNVYKPVTIYKPITIDKNINVNTNIDNSKNIDINKPVTINQNIDDSKNIDVYKPVSITNNIDASKNIDINKNIDASKNIDINKNIDASKNININKSIVINKGGSQVDASAIAAAIAEATASASAGATVYYSGGGMPDTPTIFAGGDLGSMSVNVEQPAAPAQCTFQDSTVIKAVHAVCVSADGREFPASHMVPDTWISASYEGEIARCIPGAHLKIVIGAVFQSSEGMASSWSHGQVLECGPHEAVRHFKNGMLKCAPAVPVPDCTERTNLRKYGTSDMFFTYVTKVCLETHQEYSDVAPHADALGGYSHAEE